MKTESGAPPTRRWVLALLLAALGMLGPFAIDAYLPAFGDMATRLQATPVQLQQTLSSFLLGFAVMNLFHGALSDSLGRKPVVLVAVAVFTVSSVGCALSESVSALIAFRTLQGLSAGAGMVISRAIIRDLYAPEDAQRLMALVTIFFGAAPVVAPLLGGLLSEALGWPAVFWLLAALGLLLWWWVYGWLPESLPAHARQALNVRHLLRGYAQLMRHPKFVALVLASSIPFNGMFLYVLSAPAFLGSVLHLQPTQFFWFFVVLMVGVMGGAWFSGRMAGQVKPRHQIRHGLLIMLLACLANVALNVAMPPNVAWAMLPVSVYAFGWSLMTPAVTLLALDQVPDRRGMASSIQSSLGSLVNAAVAGLLAPWVMHSALGLAWAASALFGVGLWAWLWVKPRLEWPSS